MESEIIDNVFDFSDRTAREIMIPRKDMICLFVEDSYEDNLKVIMDTSHTRYPVCEEDKDHVIGMVHLRDVLELEAARKGNKDIRSIMREILMVHEGMALTDILTLMRKKRIHMTGVADEYGGIAGFLAMEDLLEEIVGDIQDEHDEDETLEIETVEQGVYEFDGKVLLDEVTELLSIALDEHEEDTIGGYMFGLLGRRPKVGDTVTIGNYRFAAIEVNGFRIVRLKATPIAETETKGQAV
jgi:CBS domain containing-hemolysin-like protein